MPRTCPTWAAARPFTSRQRCAGCAEQTRGLAVWTRRPIISCQSKPLSAGGQGQAPVPGVRRLQLWRGGLVRFRVSARWHLALGHTLPARRKRSPACRARCSHREMYAGCTPYAITPMGVLRTNPLFRTYPGATRPPPDVEQLINRCARLVALLVCSLAIKCFQHCQQGQVVLLLGLRGAGACTWTLAGALSRPSSHPCSSCTQRRCLPPAGSWGQ